MTPEQTTELVVFARTAGAKFPDGNPATIADVWHRVLGRWPEADVRAAIIDAVAVSPFLDLSAVVDRVKAIRADRLDRFGERPAPNADPDDPKAYAAELAAMRDAIADGAFRREHVADYVASGRSIAAKRSGQAIAAAPVVVPGPGEVEAGKAAAARYGIEAGR